LRGREFITLPPKEELMTTKKIQVLERPVLARRYGGGVAHIRIRIHIKDKNLREDLDSRKRLVVNKMRKEVLPVVYSMLKFDDIYISSKETKAWYSSNNGGGAYYEGFVIYGADKKLSGRIYSVKLAYEGFDEDDIS